MSARILIVDDVPANTRLLEAKLQREYYDVVAVHSGADAIAYAKEYLPDILLLDVMMPEMDGFEVSKTLKSDPRTMHIPIIMVTALSDIEDRVRGLEAGADDFLTKPINDTELFARIRSLVRLKLMMDEIRLRNQTSEHLGLLGADMRQFSEPHPSRVLLVDDDRLQIDHISASLKRCYVDVIVLEDPHRLVGVVSEHPFDLVIVNTTLTEVDGLRLCVSLRNSEHTRNTPILILVEEHDIDLIVKGLDLGINDYLVMPIDGNELIARVNTLIKRKRYQDALRANYYKGLSMAVTDELTKLYNRRYLDVHLHGMLERSLKQHKPMALLMFDVDYFKDINDTYGHLVGDEVLRQIASRVMKNLRATDLTARYGGEEIVIVLPDTTPRAASIVADRIHRAISQEAFQILQEKAITVTVSIGVAVLLPGDLNTETLLGRADKALYKAKNEGRNRVVLDQAELFVDDIKKYMDE